MSQKEAEKLTGIQYDPLTGSLSGLNSSYPPFTAGQIEEENIIAFLKERSITATKLSLSAGLSQSAVYKIFF